MAYDKKEIFRKSKEVIEKNKCLFIEDVVDLLPCCKTTFYSKIKIDSKEYKEIAEMIEKNRVSIKIALRKKWFDSDNAKSQEILYRLCASKEELHRMSIRHTENKTDLNIEVPLFGDDEDEEQEY